MSTFHKPIGHTLSNLQKNNLSKKKDRTPGISVYKRCLFFNNFRYLPYI